MASGEHGPRRGLVSEVEISLPADAVASTGGFSIDIGSSMAKIIYRSKSHYTNGEPIKPLDDPKRGTACYALFPRNDVEGVVKHLNEKCDFKRNDDGIVDVWCSGVGGSSFKSDIEKGLNAKMNIVSEMVCFLDGFTTLTKIYSDDELVHPPVETSGIAEMKKQYAEYMAKREAVGESMNFGLESRKTESEEESADGNPHLPCLLFVCGSGVGVFKINKDGSQEIFEGPILGGRAFYGLASHLGGTNDFRKLMEMAGKADGKSCDTWSADLLPKKKEGEEEDAYNSFDMDIMCFPFGRLVEAMPGEAKKEDLVYSLYNVAAALEVQTANCVAELTGVRKAYVVGNLFEGEVGRKIFTDRSSLTGLFLPPDKVVDFKFVKNGGMIGVVGAFIHKADKAQTEEPTTNTQF